MSDSVFFSIGEMLKIVYHFLLSITLPMAIIVGAAIVAYAVKGSVMDRKGQDLSKSFGSIFAYCFTGIFIICAWTGLKSVESLAQDKIYRKRSQATSEEPVIKAPPIEQAGPVAATMVEKTYRRTLTLPPAFFERIGAEGVGVLSPYLVDPSTENVRSMVDSFRRSGGDVVFSRELTRADESPVRFDSADVDVSFKRLTGRAYHVDFAAEYVFTNELDTPVEGRFLFYPPQNGGTIQGLKVEVDGERVDEPDERGNFVWLGEIGPGEEKHASVSYESDGTSSWNYQLGSTRRRVRDFRLTASIDGPIEFRSGTINPSSRDDKTVEWRLNDVLTSQRLGLVFPEDIAARDRFLDSLGSLPVTMVVMLMALVVAGMRTGRTVSPKRLALAVVTVVVGLGSSAALYELLGYSPSVFFGSLLAAAASAAVVEWRSIALLLPVALLPAASLSKDYADAWLLLLAGIAVVLLVSPLYSRQQAE
jgi:hypothetical protein